MINEKAASTPAPQGSEVKVPTVSPGQVNDPALDRKFSAKMKSKIEDAKEHMSIADRLTRRAKTQTIFVPFSDDLGEFEIELRLPTAAEQDRMVELDHLMKEGVNDEEKIKAATEEIYKTMAALAVDPALDYVFFKSGSFLGSDLGIMIKAVMQADQDRLKATVNFRKK